MALLKSHTVKGVESLKIENVGVGVLEIEDVVVVAMEEAVDNFEVVVL